LVNLNKEVKNIYNKNYKKMIKDSEVLVPVAHVYNPTYLGRRDQEEHGLRPAQANSSPDPT
jgi:hypothetical protein